MADSSLVQTILRTTFILALFGFILFSILFIIHYTVYPILSFKPGDGGVIPIPTLSDYQIAYKDKIAPASEATAFEKMQSCSYTVGFDAFLQEGYSALGLPRILLYRSASQKTLTSRFTINPDSTTGNPLSTVISDTNILIWLHPTLNDLYVSVVTTGSGGATALLTSKPVTNLPIRKTFRVGVVFTQKFVEIYINGKLRITHILANQPTQIDTGNFYPVLETLQTNVSISNLTYWGYNLTPREMEAYGANGI